MRIGRVAQGGRGGLALKVGDDIVALIAPDLDLDAIVAAGGDRLQETADLILSKGAKVSEHDLTFLPLLSKPPKILCLGLNYAEHASEGGLAVPECPTLFVRFPTTLVGHGQAILAPKISDQLDYECELAVIIGTGGKHIGKADALKHVLGYSAFNDASVRDFQLRTPQWTAGKNFDGTGGFGPWLVTADELPPGGEGLRIQTRLNGVTLQDASTSEMVFDVPTTIAFVSSFMTLEPGDVLVMGTPAGVGATRDPPIYMRPGDLCEVEVEGIGVLRNPVAMVAD